MDRRVNQSQWHGAETIADRATGFGYFLCGRDGLVVGHTVGGRRFVGMVLGLLMSLLVIMSGILIAYMP